MRVLQPSCKCTRFLIVGTFGFEMFEDSRNAKASIIPSQKMEQTTRNKRNLYYCTEEAARSPEHALVSALPEKTARITENPCQNIAIYAA